MAEQKIDLAAKLHALQERFILELPERLAEIERQWQVAQACANVAELHRCAHSLAGTAGTFGFHRLGEHARALELLITRCQGGVACAQTISEIEQSIVVLQALAAHGPEQCIELEKLPQTPVASKDGRINSLVYILEDDALLAAEMANQLQHFGYRAEMFHSAEALKLGVVRKVPSAIVADIQLPDSEGGGMSIATELRGGTARNVPVIFISGSDAWHNRLSAVRAGGQAYLSKPVNYGLLVELLDSVTGNRLDAPYRILIVDDEPLLSQHYALVLQSAGMQTQIINEPTQLLEVLPVFSPDLLLMDIYMPGCTGVEAAQVIRQHTSFTNLPIVYLSTEQGLEQQLEALRVGGDDFLQKPISDAHLVAAVRIRARRFRDLSALMNRDSLTGLLNHINLKLALEREISQALRRSSVLSFAMLDIDLFKSVNDTYGHPLGDRVIKSLARLLIQRLRKGDIAARYGGEEFALILLDTSAADAKTLLDDLRQQFSEISHSHPSGDFTVTFSAGIAACQPHLEMEALIAAADSALYQAKHSGRNQIGVDTKTLTVLAKN